MKKRLIAYFSASGITKKVAEKMAAATGADLFEIQPGKAYTKADLDWTDRHSRSTLEMQDRNCRPNLLQVADISAYQVIFVGFPVWWYREPSIIDTFLESADFTGKIVVAFCTSGGSGLGESAANLQKLAPGAEVLPGKRFASSVSADELRKWAEQF